MTQRRRMSRAAVESDPVREVQHGISARSWWPDRYSIIDDALPRPLAQDAALFRREDVLAAMQRGMIERREADALLALTAPQPSAREAVWDNGRSDPIADIERAFARQAIADAKRREAVAEAQRDAERRAVERTGRVLVTWLIGRWRR